MVRPALRMWDCIGAVLALVVVLLAFARVHVRVQTTLIGYQIGSLKDSETKLLEQRSRLKMELAQISTQERLMELAAADEERSPP